MAVSVESSAHVLPLYTNTIFEFGYFVLYICPTCSSTVVLRDGLFAIIFSFFINILLPLVISFMCMHTVRHGEILLNGKSIYQYFCSYFEFEPSSGKNQQT